ncbi:MAG: DUF1573 domain-containing protein [Flavobacteriales bacterium]|nr:DUF1573 domain-containing protein [Flavobacteriales bacterium]
MKDNIKIGLLAIIAITLVANTFMDKSGHSDSNDGHNHDHADIQADPNMFKQDPPNPDPTAMPPEVKPVGPTTNIQFAENAFDFGKVNQDSENKHIFKFTNTGTEPLIISNAKGSCGCTVPKYPKEPIPVGATGEIEVVYKPGKQKGAQTKTVTVTANTEPSDTRIQITADVQEVAG